MNIPRAKLLLLLAAMFGLHSAKLEAATYTNFFSGQTNLGEFGNGYSGYYLPYFNYYARSDSSPNYVYKFNFGYLYFLGPYGQTASSTEAYFYDFTRGDYFYTSTTLYPYFYSFSLGSFLYYFENSSPRQFYEFKTSAFATY